MCWRAQRLKASAISGQKWQFGTLLDDSYRRCQEKDHRKRAKTKSKDQPTSALRDATLECYSLASYAMLDGEYFGDALSDNACSHCLDTPLHSVQTQLTPSKI
jgi:hypothetical protein